MFFVIVLYLPPHISSTDFEQFFELLSCIEFLYEEHVFLIGGFNISGWLGPTRDIRCCCVDTFLNTFSLRQYNTVLNDYNSLLDLVISDLTCNIVH